MKLKKILRTIIKEQDPDELLFPRYSGCNLSAPNTGAGNQTVDKYPSQHLGIGMGQWYVQLFEGVPLTVTAPEDFDSMTPGFQPDPAHQYNNAMVIHQLWGNMQPGQVVKTYTCPPTATTCNPACIRFLGFEAGHSEDLTFGFGTGANVSQVLGNYDSCQACAAGLNPLDLGPPYNEDNPGDFELDPDYEPPSLYGCMDDGEQEDSPYPGLAADDYAGPPNGIALYPDGPDLGKCNYSGCTDDTAENFVSYPVVGSEIWGGAFTDDGSCQYDTDGDGILDDDEIVGCQDETALNYDSTATDSSDNCVYWSAYEELRFCCDLNATNYGYNIEGISINGTVSWPVPGSGYGGNFVDTYVMLGGYPFEDYSLCDDICEYPELPDPDEKTITPIKKGNRISKLAFHNKKIN
jgi:hypothetical protein